MDTKSLHYMNIRDAVEQASRGQEPMEVIDLTRAITSGLYQWGANQKELMKELAVQLLADTGEPYKVDNLAEGRTE